jgi:hypothetical protein
MSIFCVLQFVAQICWKQTVLGLFVVGENRNCYLRKIIRKKKKKTFGTVLGGLLNLRVDLILTRE